jgi:hypothetical protein
VSRSLLKLVDYSLFPALIIVSSKAIGVFVVSRLYGVNISLREFINSIDKFQPAISQAKVVQINTFSDLIMYISIATIFSIVLVRAVFFHNSHVKPTLVSRLIEKNMFHLIKNSYEIYHEGAVALGLLWLTNIVILINYSLGRTEFLVLALASITTVILSLIFFSDVHREIENIKTKPGEYKWKLN